MRLIFTSLGTYGHLYPLLPLALAARDAGHRVTFVTSDDFGHVPAAAGLDVAAAGRGLHEAFTTVFETRFPGQDLRRGAVPPPLLLDAVGLVFGDTLPRAKVADLEPILRRERPDLVVAEIGDPGGVFAAALAGVPFARHGFGALTSSDVGVGIRARASRYAAELGLGDLPAPYLDVAPASAHDPALLAQLTAGPSAVPRSSESPSGERRIPHTRRVPVRPVGWSEPGALPPGVLGRTRPLAYLTLGTAMGTVAVLRAAIDGLSVLEDLDVLVATGPTVDPAALGPVGDHVRLLPWVPQARLLAHVDLVVHHGGSGTTLGAFGAGRPQLLLPQGADQFSNGDVVTRLGVGAALIGDDATPAAIAAAVRRLRADPSVAAACASVAAEVAAMPAPAAVAAHLADLT